MRVADCEAITFLILELPLTIPAPRAEDLGTDQILAVGPIKSHTCLLFFLAMTMEAGEGEDTAG